ncbi:MAG: hypothetical protein U9Q63_04170, partial [Patescibacteria group bacterium]|nr:hypothetical protein [Patescibacteria group bacterium]
WKIITNNNKALSKVFNSLIAVSLLLMSFAFGWYEVRGFFNINHPEIIAAGQAVDRLLPKDAVVIAPYSGDPAFLYQTNRPGWPVGVEIENKIKFGSTHYVSVNHDEVVEWLSKECQVLESTDQYIIIDLQPCQHLAN